LAALRSYRYILAAFLLTLYAFIAIPVQLWHHHQNILAAKPGIVAANTESDTVSQSSDLSSDTHCQACSHKYSTYHDDAIVPFQTLLLVIAAKNDCYALQLIAAPALSLPNKGPPSLS
jgi:hypothetical protein